MAVLLIRQLNLLKPRQGISVLQWSVLIFLIGEAFCGVDIYLFQEMTLLNELIHETAMMFSFSGFIWSGMILFHFDQACFGFGCTQRSLCQTDPEDCTQAQTMFGLLKIILLGLMIIASMPFFANPFSTTETLVAGIGGKIFGSYRIDDYSFLWDFRLRLAPLIPLFAFAFVMIRLLIKTPLAKRDRIILYFGFGFLVFILNRLFLLYVFRENGVWGNLFEEMQEFMVILLLLIWSKKQKYLNKPVGKPIA